MAGGDKLGHTRMTVITATTRLSRELGQEYDRGQVASGLSSWPTAHILPFSEWLSELWTECLYSVGTAKALRLLRPAEERAIWEDIVRSTADNLLLEVPATAAAALDAWNLRCAWNLPLDAPEWNDSSDSQAFHLWAGEFTRRCLENGWLSGAELPAYIANRIDEGALPVSERIEIAGFLDPTPVQKRVFDSLVQHGGDVHERGPGDSPGHAVRVGLVDGDREIRGAAAWARHILEHDPAAIASAFRIGVIVPDLSRCRSRVERLFAEEFHPGSCLRPDLDPRRFFNLSLGQGVNEYPIIGAALLILETHPDRMPVETLGRLLRSPFIHGSHGSHGSHGAGGADGADSTNSEWTRRALLDVALRRLREPELSLADVIGMAENNSAPHYCPQMASQLRAWIEEWMNREPRAAPSEWAAAISRLLAAIGWPGEGSLTSAEYQTVAVWNELLSELAGLDSVTERMLLDTAVGILRRSAASRQFQPESYPAPVQILGVFEASGLQFDRLWVMGMHDGAWPGSVGPDPFLPSRLQRRFNLPRSSPDRELEFTRVLTARLLASSPSIVVSYPEREDDADLRVSPLFHSLSEVTADDLGLLGSDRYVEQLLRSSLLERLEDDDGPPSRDAAPGGGTSLFKLQATCPFKAFAELRLGAEALNTSEPGLSARDRGQLIHGVLERVWKELKSHAGLLSTGNDRLSAIVGMTVAAEINDLSEHRRALGRPLLAAIEKARLKRLVMEWLTTEKQRQPFTVLEREESRRVTVGGIELRTRADRVDRLDSGELVILDYKTGECSPSDWDGPRPDEPQLPIYAVTADSPVSGVLFGRLKTGKVGFRGLANTEGIVPGVKPSSHGPSLENTIGCWRADLDQLGQDFRNGRAAVDPKDRRQSCEYCRLPSLCRINQTDPQAEQGNA